MAGDIGLPASGAGDPRALRGGLSLGGLLSNTPLSLIPPKTLSLIPPPRFPPTIPIPVARVGLPGCTPVEEVEVGVLGSRIYLGARRGEELAGGRRGDPIAPLEAERERTRVGVESGRVMNTSLPDGASVSSARERLTELANGGACTACASVVLGANRTAPPGGGVGADDPSRGRRRTTSHRTSSSPGIHCTLTT